MANATDLQVQQYVNERVRTSAEQLRALYYALKDHKAVLDDVYAALTQEAPTWSDDRPDGPPHLLAPSDVLAWNTFVSNLLAAIEGDAQWPVVLKACVRALPGA